VAHTVQYEILSSHGNGYEDTVFWNMTMCRLTDCYISEKPVALKMNYTSFYPEDGGSIFLKKVGNDVPDYMVLHKIKQKSSYIMSNIFGDMFKVTLAAWLTRLNLMLLQKYFHYARHQHDEWS
jgi:hypothetical protein